MAREFKENAHLKTDLNKFGDNHDHIFNRSQCKCEECKPILDQDRPQEAREVSEFELDDP
jgi:hypothetical protein